MPTAFITGANSGIGHAFAKILLEEGYTVYAADLDLGPTIKSLGCQTIHLDLTSSPSIQAASATLSNQPLDVLLNVAGIMSAKDQDSLGNITQSTLQSTFAVNTFGPILLTQALLPNLLQADAPRIGVVSSRVGSMADNSSGGSYAYRASKAGVNSLFKSLAVDLKEKGVPVSILHPGIVKTGLDKSGETHRVDGAVEPEEAAGKLWALFKGKGIGDTGRFWHREGEELPW